MSRRLAVVALSALVLAAITSPTRAAAAPRMPGKTTIGAGYLTTTGYAYAASTYVTVPSRCRNDGGAAFGVAGASGTGIPRSALVTVSCSGGALTAAMQVADFFNGGAHSAPVAAGDLVSLDVFEDSGHTYLDARDTTTDVEVTQNDPPLSMRDPQFFVGSPNNNSTLTDFGKEQFTVSTIDGTNLDPSLVTAVNLISGGHKKATVGGLHDSDETFAVTWRHS